MVTESTKKMRELLGATLIGVAAVLALVWTVSILFSENGELSERALFSGETVLQPILVILAVAGVLGATHFGEPTPKARLLTIAGIGVLGFMLLAGVVMWVAGLVADVGFNGPTGGKFAFVLTMLALLALVSMALYFCVVVFRALPAPVKPQPQQQWAAQQQWGQHPQQQWGGQQWGQPQEQPHPQQQQWGQTGWAAPAQGYETAPPEQPQPQQPGQPAWGQPEQAAEPQQTWAQPADEQPTTQWGEPAAQPAEEHEQPVEQTDEDGDDDDPRPGWWQPSAQ